MSGMKPVYLLAGGRPRSRQTPDPLIQAVFREAGKAAPVIAYTGTANGDDTGFFSFMVEPLRAAGASRVDHAVISPENADLKKARDVLHAADIVFVGGGDVDGGMRILQEKEMAGFLTGLYQQGKLFFGTSAGAIMLAKEWVRWTDPDDSTSAELFPCLGFASVICDCHDEEGGWEELKAALMLEEDDTTGYGIPAGAAIRVFPDGKIEALGSATHRYVREGEKVSRTPDIIPVSDTN